MNKFVHFLLLLVMVWIPGFGAVGARTVGAAGILPDDHADGIFGQEGHFNSNGTINSIGISRPRMVVFDGGGMYISDMYNDRVLYYPNGSAKPTRVYGQGGDFTTIDKYKGAVNANSLFGPEAMAVDSAGNLYVTDTHNSRVLFYPAGSTTATRVYGQGDDFTTKTENKNGVSAASLRRPEGIALDSAGNLYVADTMNNRVLYYPAGSTTATRVYGQGDDFTTTTENKDGVSASSLSKPQGVMLDSAGNLYVADAFNHRVLVYPPGSTTATRVYGQGDDFTTNTQNKGGISAGSLYRPTGVALDTAGNLYIADTWNHRVLVYSAGSTTATRVYGQGDDFTTGTTNKGGVSANSLNNPMSVTLSLDGSTVYIADWSNNRVLTYAGSSTTANGVYGQINFISSKSNILDNAMLKLPQGILADANGNVYVADQNHRILYYPAGSTTATRVYGQGGDFSTNTDNKGGVSADSLSFPKGMALDSTGNLYVADSKNNRVLMYSPGSTTATRVYGQGGDFTTNTQNKGGVSATSLNGPSGMALDSVDNLYVADAWNNRVLVYPAGSATATRVYGQGGDFTTATENKGGISAESMNVSKDLSVDGFGNLYVADSMNHRALIFLLANAPSARASAATAITASGATLTGTVNANHADTTVSFEYGLDTTYGQSLSATPATVTGDSDTPVSVTLSGLRAGVTYHFRVTAVNAMGTTYSADQTFTTQQDTVYIFLPFVNH